MIYTKTGWGMDTLVEEGFRSEIEELGVGGICRGRICGPVNFGTIKTSKEKAVGAVCDKFGKDT